MKKYLIFTDLDGTLLDHYSYSFSPALPLLERLQQEVIPVIFNTSKTQAELDLLQKEMNIDAPFIIENGAAIYLPQKSFPQKPTDCIEDAFFWKKEMARPRQYWLKILEELDPKIRQCFKGFSEMSVEEISSLTGLNHDKAILASKRGYGEPIYWQGAEDNKLLLAEYINKNGGQLLQGGRFLHVGDKVDKGLALLELLKIYEHLFPEDSFHTIALGDGMNDIAMLESSHTAVIIKSPVSPFPQLSRTDQLFSTMEGPRGWKEVLEQILYR